MSVLISHAAIWLIPSHITPCLYCVYGYGDHRVLHVLTHSCPTRRASDLRLIDDYERTVGGLLVALDGGNVDLAAEIAAIPEHVRGYGHVKEAHLHKAK